MLSLYKLEIFALVVEEGSLSGAAHRLYMSHAAVSQHIRELEATLGTKLFDRGRRGVKLTAAGDKLYHHTQIILHQVALAENELTHVENVQEGQVSIGATPGISTYFFPEWLRRFREHLPHISAALHTNVTDTIADKVSRRELDIGFTEGHPSEQADTLGMLALRDVPQYVVVGQHHIWWKRETVSLQELNSMGFITRQPGSKSRQWLEGLLLRNNVQAHIVAEFDNQESIKRAVRVSDSCVTILPDYAVQDEQSAGVMRAIRIDDINISRTLFLIWNNTMPISPFAKAFLRTLQTDYPALRELA